jgi:multiple sugar transport system permease protein
MESSANIVTPGARRPNWITWALNFVKYRIPHGIEILVLLFFSIIFLAPIVWTVSTSLRLPAQSFTVPPKWIPTDFYLDNYVQVFKITPFGSYIKNSVIVTLSIVMGQLVTASLAGYAFARLRFPGKEVLFVIILATMMIPLQATIIPIFVLISKLGLADTLTALIVPAWPTAFGTFLLRQYFMTIPDELHDAAVIDGANQFTIFSRIYLPLVKIGLAVLAVLSFNNAWNEFFRPLIFLNTDTKFTIQLGLVNLKGYMGGNSISVVIAGIALAMIPVFIIYLFGQRYLVEGIVRTGLKG